MKAIVIVYNGNRLREVTLQQISELVGQYAKDGSRVDITVMSDSELASTLAKGPTIAVGDFPPSKPAHRTDEDMAVIFLGEKYMPYIADETAFFTHLIKDYVLVEHKAYKDEEDESLVNAMRVLGKKQVVVSADLMKKYNFTKAKLNKIYELYKAL